MSTSVAFMLMAAIWLSPNLPASSRDFAAATCVLMGLAFFVGEMLK